jgi:hypothetical protein
MNLIKLDIEEISKDVFGDIGKLKGDPVKIKLKENMKPYHVNTSRRIPIPLIPKVERVATHGKRRCYYASD